MSHSRALGLGALLIIIIIACDPLAIAGPSLADLPLTYERNLGQAHPDVAFICRSRAFDVFLTRDEAVLAPRTSPWSEPREDALRMRFLDRADDVRLEGRSRRLGRSSYFRGTDPARWVRGAPHFGEAVYSGMWPGVDLVFRSRDGDVAYDFVLEPGADPASIRLSLSGADRVEIDSSGDLVIEAGGRTLCHTRPVAFQPRDDSSHREVTGRWTIESAQTEWLVGFEVGVYDRREALVIDPRIVFSTYLGARAGLDRFEAIAIDNAGFVYVTGNTESSAFPADNPAGVDTTLGGGVVAKLSPDGRALIWAAYVGSSSTFGRAIALDDQGVVYVAGDSASGSALPTTADALFPAEGRARDAFLMKIHPRGDEVLYATYLHGPAQSDHDQVAFGLAVDAGYNMIVAGYTNSRYVTEAAFQDTYGGANDAFVTSVRADGRAVIYSTHLGGVRRDQALDVAVDPAGYAYVVGRTDSEDFPLWPEDDPLRPFQAGGFVASLSPAGELVYSTYLGGTGGFPRAVAVDAGGRAHVVGAAGGGFQEVNPIFDRPTLGGFVARIAPEGAAIELATLLEDGGGSSNLTATGIALDARGDIYVTGFARALSADRLPIVDPVQTVPEFRGTEDAFVLRLAADLVDHVPVAGADDADDVFLFSTWLGGGDPDRIAGATSQGKDIAVTADGRMAVVGNTSSAEFPVTLGALMRELPGPARSAEPDAFVAVIDPDDEEEVPFLHSGIPETITLTPGEPAASFRMPSLPGQATLLCITDADAADANVLAVRLNRPATRSVFDLAADRPGRPSQALLLPYTAAGLYYVRVEATQISGGSNVIEVCANVVDLAVTGVSPVRGGVDRRVGATISGAGFLPGTRFFLERGNALIPQSEATLISGELADVEFDLTGAQPGNYVLGAERDGIPTVRSELSFEVVENPRPDFLIARLEGMNAIRGNVPIPMTLVYENTGDTPIEWPLLDFSVATDAALEILLRLDSEDEFQTDSLQVFGATPGDVLGPGESGRVPVILQAIRPRDGGGGGIALESFTVRVSRLLPLPGDFVPWDRGDELIGASGASEAEMLSALSAVLGPRWEDYGSSLAGYARRHALRGKDPASVREVFLFAARDALRQARGDQRRMAAAGRLVSDFTGEPVPRTALGAMESDVLVSKTITDDEGRFCLDRLLPGTSYRLVATGYQLPSGEVRVPADGDATGLVVLARPRPPVTDGSAVGDDGEAIDIGDVEIEPEEPLPVERALVLPEQVASTSSELRMRVGIAIDPNEKHGPLGEPEPEPDEDECDDGAISGEGELYYTIYFENEKDATTPAQTVVIEDQLSAAFDWTSFRPVAAGVGERVLSLETRQRSLGYSTSTIGRSISTSATTLWPDVRVECDYDAARGSIVFTFRTFSAELVSGPPPGSPEGFLPPNREPPMGEGRVTFTVKRSLEGLGEGGELDNEATITFLPEGVDEPLTTNTYCNPIAIEELPLEPGPQPLYPPDSMDREVPTELVVNWAPSPRPATYDVCLWEIGANMQPAQCPGPQATVGSRVAASRLRVAIEPGKLYHWQVTARDDAGATARSPVWTFRSVGAPPPAPAIPALLSPPPGAVEVPPTPTLSWQRAADAVAYRVRVWPRDGGAPPFEVSAVTGTSITLPRRLLPSTTYLWQITALNQTGDTPAEIREFTTAGVAFRRGDVNGDGGVGLTDATLILGFLFGGEGRAVCLDALDANDTGAIDVSDAIFLLQHLFAGGRPPPAPGPDECGKDGTPDDGLGCLEGC